MQRDLPVPALAKISVLVALAAAPLCLLAIGRSGFPWAALLAMVPQAVALALAARALREAEDDPEKGGRSLALTAIFAGGVFLALIVMFSMYAPRVWT
jgi:dolichol kinase